MSFSKIEIGFEMRRLLHRMHYGGGWHLIGRMRRWKQLNWIKDGWGVIDGGAHIGSYTAAIHLVLPASRIIAVEPFAKSRLILSKQLKRIKSLTIEPIALAQQCGEATMNESENEQINSLLPPSKLLLDEWPSATVAGHSVVRTESLDALVARCLPEGPIFLKLDIQGLEGEVFKGTYESWPRIKAIQCEMSLVDLYAGSPRFEELVGMLHEKGYHLADTFDFLIAPNSRIPISCDCLFISA